MAAGIVHCDSTGVQRGLQLWINLSSRVDRRQDVLDWEAPREHLVWGLLRCHSRCSANSWLPKKSCPRKNLFCIECKVPLSQECRDDHGSNHMNTLQILVAGHQDSVVCRHCRRVLHKARFTVNSSAKESLSICSSPKSIRLRTRTFRHRLLSLARWPELHEYNRMIETVVSSTIIKPKWSFGLPRRRLSATGNESH
ncbi:hypothetical protein SELMODRAFT_403641 [Selaginella moellendorffii]|uniref:Uncharacterized protein n=1 Tax=Selaginella moellendorffii TaxID=88036 RepID=D8QS28_SELML|nr:hypothetical protein SELMODRAFT_403641 [Selaginella moellendorffii]